MAPVECAFVDVYGDTVNAKVSARSTFLFGVVTLFFFMVDKINNGLG